MDIFKNPPGITEELRRYGDIKSTYHMLPWVENLIHDSRVFWRKGVVSDDGIKKAFWARFEGGEGSI